MRNGIYPESGLLDQWPDGGPELIGTVSGIGDGYGSPTVTADGIFIAGMIDTLGYVFHFDKELKFKWKTLIGPEFNYKYIGSRGSPTIEGNRLYYVASMGDAVCLHTSTGEKIWHLNIRDTFDGLPVKWGYTESPLIYDEKIFFTPGGPGSNFIALNKMSGELIWESAIDSAKNAYCSPVIINHKGKDLILLNTSHYILLLDPDNGDVFVKHPLSNTRYNHALAPIYSEGTLFYSSGYGEGSTLFRIREGRQTMDTVYSNLDFDCKISGMIEYQGVVYGTSDRRKLWTGVDLKSGKTVFTSREFKPGSFVMADNKFFLYDDKGEVGLAIPDSPGFTVVSRFQIPAGMASYAFAHPVIHDGILYIRYTNDLWLYRVR